MDLKLEVSAGASRKLNRQQYGGAAYESSDVWVSFKKELPSDADQSLVEATARHLQKMADRELEAEVKRVIQSVAPKTPPAQGGSSDTTPASAPLSVARSASQTPSSKEPGDCQWPGCDKDGKGFKTCFQHSQALKAGAVPASPKVQEPDTPEGAPFP